MKTYHNFKNIENFQHFLRTRYDDCTHGSGCLDYVNIGGITFTMHEYDMGGQSITWANKKHNRMIECTTANRYRVMSRYRDAEVIEWEPLYLREDITYAQ